MILGGPCAFRLRLPWTLEHLAGLLRAQEARIRTLSDGERDVGAVFDLSCQGLPAAHLRLFRLLGLIPGPDLDAHAAAAMARTDPASATRLLESLTDHNLVIQHTAGRAHALVTPFPHPAPAGPAPAHPPVLQDPDAAWRWLRAERPNLLAAVQHASDHASPDAPSR